MRSESPALPDEVPTSDGELVSLPWLFDDDLSFGKPAPCTVSLVKFKVDRVTADQRAV